MEIEAVRDPAMVYADIGLMQRVLENLIRNALKFTPPDGRITINIDPQSDHVSVAVSDTGCGINDEDLEHIFDRFYHPDHGKNSDSTGLGLAIVKRILDLHGSRITVQSSPNQGTRFEFELSSQKSA
jgi:signal transduction histidine kinase